MNPKLGYEDWWDMLMYEQFVNPAPQQQTEPEYVSPYNTGDVLIGEIVEEGKELTP